MAKPWAENLKRLARKVDWPRALQMGATFVRELQGDAGVDADHERARRRALQFRKIGEDAARSGAGCARDRDCDCIVCRELGPA